MGMENILYFVPFMALEKLNLYDIQRVKHEIVIKFAQINIKCFVGHKICYNFALQTWDQFEYNTVTCWKGFVSILAPRIILILRCALRATARKVYALSYASEILIMDIK